MNDDNQNMALWDSVCTTDETYTRKLTFGAKLTAIDATWQKRRATSLWGPYGAAWGLRNLRWGYVASADGLPAEMWLEISSDMGWKRDDDCRKKLQTDTIKKALSYLGFSADVYMGAFDDEKYTEAKGLDQQRDMVEKIVGALKAAPDQATLDRYMAAAKDRHLNRFWTGQVQAAYSARKSTLEQEGVFGGDSESVE